MNFISHNNYVLCIQISKDIQNLNQNSLIFKVPDIPRYKIVKLPKNIKDDSGFNPGDIIIINSKPTKVKDNNQEYFLVNLDHIVGKIV